MITSLRTQLIRSLSPVRAGPHRHAHPEGPDEEGAVMILALVFLVSISLIVVGLLSWLSSSLNATAAIGSARALQNDSINAVNLAIQETRTSFASQLENASPPQPCWYASGVGQQPPTDANTGNTIDVYCSMVWNPSSTSTRVVTYSACPAPTVPTTTANATCAANPTLQVVATYNDYTTPVVTPAPTPVPCNDTGLCGQTMTVNSWQWSPTVPVVTALSVNTSSTAGGTPLTITGTGFVPGATVNFVQETSGANSGPSSANIILTQTSSCVSVSANNTCTQLTTTTPAVTSGTDYYVTVTTPGGTSPYVTPGGTSLDLAYTTTAPTVTAISGPNITNGNPTGSVAGGSVITLTGTGFYSTASFPTEVFLHSGNTSVPATNVQVTSDSAAGAGVTQLTATTPAVSATGNWYVQVSTGGGTSTGTSFVFAYVAQLPLVIGISPGSGGPTSGVSQITITGSNFLASGTSVSFYLDSSGSPTGSAIAASSTVTSSTALTVVLPTTKLTKNSSYFPEVTTTISGSTNTSQTYNESADIFTYTG